MEERRQQGRTDCPPELLSATFRLDDGSAQGQIWSLRVLEVSKTGLKLLVTEVDADLLDLLKPGHVIENITFYGEETLIRVDATIKHITQIGYGDYRGQHAIGLESEEVITSYLPI